MPTRPSIDLDSMTTWYHVLQRPAAGGLLTSNQSLALPKAVLSWCSIDPGKLTLPRALVPHTLSFDCIQSPSQCVHHVVSLHPYCRRYSTLIRIDASTCVLWRSQCHGEDATETLCCIANSALLHTVLQSHVKLQCWAKAAFFLSVLAYGLCLHLVFTLWSPADKCHIWTIILLCVILVILVLLLIYV